MKLRVQHRTEYFYTQPVRRNVNEIRLQPPDTAWQRRDFWMLRVLPVARLHHFTDLRNNAVSWFEIDPPHSRLLIESTANVTTWNPYERGVPEGVPLSALDKTIAHGEAAAYLGESRYVRITSEIWRAAIDVRVQTNDVFGLATGIMKWIHANCRYEAGATAVTTGSEEFFAQMSGVCQDFAHLTIAMCRSVGLPARYVSGYLFDPGRQDLRGAHASHAWVEVFVPGHGWWGIDPTNDRFADDLCIAIATGRDYYDVAPVRGTFFGGSGHRMDVRVWVEEIRD